MDPMKITTRVIALTVFAATRVLAQGNVDVTVLPQALPGQPTPSRSGFLVCAGTASDVDKYGTETTTLTGIANQNFRNIPTNTAIQVIVSKPGFVGVQLATVVRQGTNNHLQATLVPGRGGPVCPAPTRTLSVTGTSVYPVATAPATRLPLEWFSVHGEQNGDFSGTGCEDGKVVTGIAGRHGEGIDQLVYRCSQVDSLGRVITPSPSGVPSTGSGTGFVRDCPGRGRAIVRVKGTIANGQLRGLRVSCQWVRYGVVDTQIDPNPHELDWAGSSSGTQWTDSCTMGRVVRALRSTSGKFRTGNVYADALAPTVVTSIQVGCYQPRF